MYVFYVSIILMIYNALYMPIIFKPLKGQPPTCHHCRQRELGQVAYQREQTTDIPKSHLQNPYFPRTSTYNFHRQPPSTRHIPYITGNPYKKSYRPRRYRNIANHLRTYWGKSYGTYLQARVRICVTFASSSIRRPRTSRQQRGAN